MRTIHFLAMVGTKCPVIMCHILEDKKIPQQGQDVEQKRYSAISFHIYNTVSLSKSPLTINFEDFYGNWFIFSGLPLGYL
jgi:hypothetical protein